MTASLIDVDRQAGVTVVTLRRPPVNAMNIDLTEEIASAFQNLGKDRSVKSVVLTGHGKSFCAGVDLKTVPAFGPADQRRMVDALNRAFYAFAPALFRWSARSTATLSPAGSSWRCAATGVSLRTLPSLPV